MQSIRLCITGIGNMEPLYAGTRHNAGLLMLDLLSNKLSWDVTYRKCRLNGAVKYAQVAKDILLLRCNGNYINCSGQNVVPIWKQLPKQLTHVVICDDLSLLPGEVQLRKPGTSLRGHNGLKDIARVNQGNSFYKLSVGIGRPEERDSKTVSDYVLSKLSENDLQSIQEQGVRKATSLLTNLLKQLNVKPYL